MKLTITDIQDADKRLRELERPKIPCPKCGRSCYRIEVTGSEQRIFMESIGYDGTCCHPFLSPEKT